MAKKTAWTEASFFSPIHPSMKTWTDDLYQSSAFALYDIFSSVFLWKKKYCHFTCLLSAIMIVDVSSSKRNNKLGWKWTQTARTHCPLWQKASVVKENGMNRSEQWLLFVVLWFHQMLQTKQVAAILVVFPLYLCCGKGRLLLHSVFLLSLFIYYILLTFSFFAVDEPCTYSDLADH